MAVYFIRSADGAVKIGRAKNVATRLSNLQTAHAYELKLLRQIDGGAVEEWECQHAFRDFRIRGEWFSFCEEMLTFAPIGRSKLALLKKHKEKRETEDGSAVAFIREAVRRHPMKQREIAKAMGYKPSQLSRKLRQNPQDSSRFTLDDLERFMEVTGDTSPVLYLVEKYLTESNRIAALEAELMRLKSVKGVA